MGTFALKDGMLIGAASAATQIEGGKLDHSWQMWYEKGHIADGASPSRANEHFKRWREDAALMQALGLQIVRLGVEWARIEPEMGVYDEAAIAHYINEVTDLKERGMQVLVTLHHFTNPMWFEKLGAFEKTENNIHYLRFVKKVVAAFGEKVNEYITINEPNVYATNGYFFGSWPPGAKSFQRTIRVLEGLAAAHGEAYNAIHRLRKEMGFSDTKVSFANHMRVFVPENKRNPLHCLYAKLSEWFFQGSLTKAMCLGEFALPLRNVGHLPKQNYCDFMALNYYSRSTVSGLKDGVKKGTPVNDLGWEIYPEGIVACARKLYNLAPMPIYITENGTCDNQDTFRSRYLYEHLKALSESGLPIARYYHWCFCDNFEWLEGESARFGVVHVDYETQRRTIKQSGCFLRDVIRHQGVREDTFIKYVKDQQYHYNEEC